jgi:formate hydrogenlyase subunit 6/NADH:ubiquinone oxidoreductase subunit I
MAHLLNFFVLSQESISKMEKLFRIDPQELQHLLSSLQKNDYTTVGPTHLDDAIVYDRIDTIDDLPVGWTDEEGAGKYRITKRDDGAFFGYTIPPQSWKRFLYPPTRKLFSVKANGKSFELVEENGESKKYAFIGVRACELSAMGIQDMVFSSGKYRDEDYLSMRTNAFIVAVNCGQAGENCFCASMKTGPGAKDGFDIAMTEIIKGEDHYFVAEAGTDRGLALLREIKAQVASQGGIGEAEDVVRRTGDQIKKSIDVRGLPKLLADNLENAHWDDVAKRCLTCGNCTLVCPTCFCSTVEDTTDLAGQSAWRTRRWDSCFTLEFAKVSGGNFRTSPKSRYRQWLTHKLSSWVEQFGVSGCVGCGRCITWCPVGIDLTSEVKAIRGAKIKQEKGG